MPPSQRGSGIGHTATVGLSSDGFLSLLLGADEENGAALLGDVLNEGVGLVKTDEGLLEIDDVDVTTVAECTASSWGSSDGSDDRSVRLRRAGT